MSVLAARVWLAMGLVGLAPGAAPGHPHEGHPQEGHPGELAAFTGRVRPPRVLLRAAAAGRAPGFGAAVALTADAVFCGAPAGIPPGAAAGGDPRATRRAGGLVMAARPIGPFGPWTSDGAGSVWMGPSDPAGDDGFGRAICAGPGWVAIGAPFSRAGGTPTGVVTLHAVDGATGRVGPGRALQPPALASGGGFGAAIAMQILEGGEAVLAVGAPHESDPATGRPLTGAVHLFRWSSAGPDRWVRGPVLRLRGATTGATFGSTLCFAGSTLVVGAPGQGLRAPGAGAVLGFSTEGRLRWRRDGQHAGERLGTALCTAMGTAMGTAASRRRRMGPGAPRRVLAVSAPGQGRVDVLGVSGGEALLEARLRGRAGDGFGVALALADEHLLVGAPFATVDGQPMAGEVLRYRLGVWGGAQESVVSPVVTPGAEFGAAIAALALGDGSVRFAVGEPGASGGGGLAGSRARSGAVAMFELSTVPSPLDRGR